MKKLLLILLLSFFIIRCSDNDKTSDGYGNFESVEVIVSAEANGNLAQFSNEEGDVVKKGQILGVIDTIQLHLKKEQLKSSINAVRTKTQDVQAQINVLEKQKAVILTNKARVEKLFKDSAATQKQLDDVNGQLEVIDKQIIATRTNLNTVNRGLEAETKPLEYQIKQIEDQIAKSYIKSPILGTILSKYVEEGEFVTMGKMLFKVANINEMILRVYVSGDQLHKVKIGQKVSVYIDKSKDGNIKYSGEVIWVSDKSEFTPKVIQTKEERVNLVYAVKVLVKNDGSIKIGMPGEVVF